MLRSIANQTQRPDRVYVVQPYGYKPPLETEGIEEFIHTKKGMWEQRIFGMEYLYTKENHSKYLLVCDDDVVFKEDFIKQLIKIAEENNADTVIPIQDRRQPRLQKLFLKLLGDRTENSTSQYKISIKKNGRFSVNNTLKDNINLTQSGPFQCFLMRTDITPKLNLREEMWLDDTRYAWPDDQVFFYKAYKLGLKNISCKTPSFVHLDGKSGVSDTQRQYDATYSAARNLTIFWYKFIRKYDKSLATNISFRYYIGIHKLLQFVKSALNRNLSNYRHYTKGLQDGRAYVKKIL